MKIALVSNCGFWEIDNFHPLLKQFEMLCKVEGFHFAGALLRPHGPALAPMLQMGGPVGDVFEAAKEAGRQLVENGEIAQETLKVGSRELLPRDMYLQIANQQFQQVLDLLEQNSISV